MVVEVLEEVVEVDHLPLEGQGEKRRVVLDRPALLLPLPAHLLDSKEYLESMFV